ncbi:4-hydroxythreonine-4-phosphate dehydrogenase PdxA [Sphingomonas sp. AX6]|uniref:4-hydroxythreonine-4-phosphate dehydrogenase PdxA n=1 Tax=Sphingomonas sp. AX6 TaxID=2653171 RepID=UPI0012EFCB65|nr:4-hydroxythreonine-4-phosphate dehydrogenase PdxA [Sphingomonas sp. AX6]VXC97034.1 4-hydroxythreonine-4-phosphate dehydrogenase [Sphingomonas sp. AX6]
MTAPIAISMGDPAGIGPEIIAKAWKARRKAGLSPFFAIGDPRAIETLGICPVWAISDPSEAGGQFGKALPVLTLSDTALSEPGTPCVHGARSALMALEMGVGLTRSGAACALVTGPVSKARLYSIGFSHAGQTEFVAERCGVSPDNAVMMLAGPSLRVVPITTHVPLASVSELLSVELLVARGLSTARGLRKNFGIEDPRLAFAGFNPHAGEEGAIGREEVDIIRPAIERLKSEGIDASGPFAADTMFHPRARATYDAALCCYHDQALIPLKTLHFDEGVNITLGLPIVRTSPDHGTAFDIAGKGIAEPGAMIAAIKMAGEAAARRAKTTGTAK